MKGVQTGGKSGLLYDLFDPDGYPLVKEGLIDANTLIVDAKSGHLGSRKGSQDPDNLFCEVNESIKAYGVATHRHTPGD